MIAKRAFPYQFIIRINIAFNNKICICRHFYIRLRNAFYQFNFFFSQKTCQHVFIYIFRQRCCGRIGINRIATQCNSHGHSFIPAFYIR